MAYDTEFGVTYVTTLHDQDLTVSRGHSRLGHRRLRVCIWVGEADTMWPLVFTRDEDALLIAKLLLEAVLGPDDAPQSGPC